MDKGAWLATVYGGHKKAGHDLATEQQQAIENIATEQSWKEGTGKLLHTLRIFTLLVGLKISQKKKLWE